MGMESSSVGSKLLSLYLIVQWIFLSSTIILFNKYLLSEQKFHFPITLVMMHMLFISVFARLWRMLGWTENPKIEWSDVATRFVPIALLFAVSLGLGNAAYLYISVAFIQMLKASTPVAVLLCSFAVGLETPNARLFAYIVAIAVGVMISAYGQLQLNMLGALQIVAAIAEALRLCLVNMALGQVPALTFLSIVAPLCFCVLLPAWITLEAKHVSRHHFAAIRHVGGLTLLANASVAFFLNLDDGADQADVRPDPQHIGRLGTSSSSSTRSSSPALWSRRSSTAATRLPSAWWLTRATRLRRVRRCQLRPHARWPAMLCRKMRALRVRRSRAARL